MKKLNEDFEKISCCNKCPKCQGITDKSFKKCTLTESLIMKDQLCEIAHNCPLKDNEEVCDSCDGYADLGKLESPFNQDLGGGRLERYYCSQCYKEENWEI